MFSKQNWGVATKGLSGAAKRRTPDELSNISQLARVAAGEMRTVIDGASDAAGDV